MQNPAESGPDIFQFTDFRSYLADTYAFRKSKDRRFSHRYINGKVGASSSGWFSDVVKGRIVLSASYRLKIARVLGLRPKEVDYFEAIVAFSQAASSEEKDRCFKKILSFKEVKTDLVGRDRFEYYSRWYHAAIRELLFFWDFQDNYAALAGQLIPPIKTSEAKKAVQLLERLRFISRNPQGRFVPETGALKKDASFKADNLANYHRANLELAIGALEICPKEFRDISALTLSFSPQGFAKAAEEVRSLRKRLLVLMREDSFPEKVYQCNFQMFPVTK